MNADPRVLPYISSVMQELDLAIFKPETKENLEKIAEKISANTSQVIDQYLDKYFEIINADLYKIKQTIGGFSIGKELSQGRIIGFHHLFGDITKKVTELGSFISFKLKSLHDAGLLSKSKYSELYTHYKRNIKSRRDKFYKELTAEEFKIQDIIERLNESGKLEIGDNFLMTEEFVFTPRKPKALIDRLFNFIR
ncbi:MAG: hypothetical protein OHK0017_11380 [Patescibacteria group bacterium]